MGAETRGTETRAPRRYAHNFIVCRWVVAADDARIEVEDPSSERMIALVPAGARADADRAVMAAAEARDGWSRTPPTERAGHLHALAGALEHPAGLATGHFVPATVFANVRSDMGTAQEEAFGPVLAILPYDSEEDAVRIANDSIYGLVRAVWAHSSEVVVQFARRMRTGQVDVNGGRYNLLASFGGYKQPGNGRELGRDGLEELLQPKAVQL